MKDLMAQSMLVRSSGGFDHVSFRPLFSAKEAQDAMLKANALANKFDAPIMTKSTACCWRNEKWRKFSCGEVLMKIPRRG